MTTRLRALARLLRHTTNPGLMRRWPSRCWVCGSWPTSPLCEDCVTALAQPRWRCLGCALPLRREEGHPHSPHAHTDPHPAPIGRPRCLSCRISPSLLSSCHAALDYDYPWDRCIATFKFGNQPGLARALAELMWHAPGMAPALESADLLVPMPLAHDRLHSRGYNQAHELARALRHHLPSRTTTPGAAQRYTPHVLHRLRSTRAQSALSAAERQVNLHQAFHVLPTDHAQVRGQRVVVVDDIMTTGASLQEAARALLSAGAHSVSGVVLARTPAVS